MLSAHWYFEKINVFREFSIPDRYDSAGIPWAKLVVDLGTREEIDRERQQHRFFRRYVV